MIKEDLIERLCELLDTIEGDPRADFDRGEIEELIVEARIPITFSTDE
ncbi:MAG: hypothetical protein MUO31_13180 [Thermodesulfovibrionales bacterium]|nr:hypothetical protein [Thermodesulfovibrionales bacterium]